MFHRWLNAKSKTVATAAILVSLASILSRVIGLLRDRLLTHTFGAGPELDAYYAAFRVPDLIYSLFVYGAITAGFIPVLSRYADENGESDSGASELVSRLLTLLGAVLVVAAGLGYWLAPRFTPAITPGFDAAQVALTVRLTRVMFLSPVILGLSGILGALLQTRKRFLAYAAAPILYNLGIIAGTLLFARDCGVVGVAWGVVLGASLHFLIQAWSCRRLGFKLRFAPNPRHGGLGEVLRLTAPRVMSLAAGQINVLVITSLITALGVGSLAVFNLSNNLAAFPVNIVGVAIATAAFPFISELAEKSRREELIRAIVKSAQSILFFIIPATVALLLLRAQIVRVVLGSGKFNWANTVATADVLAALSLGLFAMALLPLLVRAFFAVKDAMTPFWVNVIFAALGVLLAWIAVREHWGVVGVSLMLSVSNALNLLVLWVLLRVRLGGLEERHLLRSVALMSLAALVMAAVIQGVKVWLGGIVNMRTFVGVLTQGSAAGLAGLLVYFTLMLRAGSDEAKLVLSWFRRRFAAVPVALRQDGEITPQP